MCVYLDQTNCWNVKPVCSYKRLHVPGYLKHWFLIIHLYC